MKGGIGYTLAMGLACLLVSPAFAVAMPLPPAPAFEEAERPLVATAEEEGEGEGEDDEPPEFRDRPKRLPPFFWYERSKERDSTFFMLMMLWWQADNPERSFETFFPVFYSRLNKKTGARTVASPFFYWYTSPESTAGYIPPVYIERGKKVSRTGVPPLFWYGRTRGEEGWETTSYLFPLYFFDERAERRVLATPIGGGWGTKDDWQGLVGPYYWRNTHTDTLDLDAHVLFPFFWHVAARDWTTHVAGPAFRHTRQVEGGEKRVLGLAPFFYRRTSPGGSGTTITPLSVFERRDPSTSWLVTPLGGYSVAPGKALVVAGPWVDRFENGERFSALVPIAFHGSSRSPDGRTGSSWTVVGPYFERHRRELSRSGEEESAETVSLDRGLLPLFWYGRNGRDVRFVSPGVMFHRKENGDFRGLFGPFYRSWSSRHQTWAAFPGVWYHNGQGVRAFGALPFYYARSKRHDSVAAGLFPLFFFRNQVRDGKRDRLVTLVPLFHYSERPGRLTVLSPLYAQIRRPGDRKVMAAWLWWDHKTDDARNLTFVPFFHWERYGSDRRLLTPVGGYAAGNGFHRSIWGPVYRRRDENLGLRYDVVFPVYWNLTRPDRKLIVAGPYFQNRQGRVFFEGLAPFWFHSSYPGASQTVVFPFFLSRTDKYERTRTLFTPLGGLWTAEDPRAFKLLAPLTYLAKGPRKRQTVLFPLFWYDYDHGRQTLVIPPFFTRRDERSLRVGVLPVFYYRREPDSTLLLSPAVLYGRDEDRRTTVVPWLAYGWARDDERSYGMAGPWIWNKHRQDANDYLRMLFPFFLQTRRGPDSLFLTPVAFHARRGRRALTALPGLGWATREDTDGRVVSRAALAGPVYWRSAPDAGEAIVFPFFWHTRGHGTSVTALAPLFHYRRSPDSWHLVTLGLGAGGGEPDRAWWWVLNSFYKREGERRQAAFFPLAYAESSPSRTRLVTPLLFHDADHQTRTSTTLAPFYFRRTSPTRSTWVAFPLAYGDTDHERGISIGGVLPFAMWRRTAERTTTVIPGLLTYYSRRGEDHLGVYGPLVDMKVGGRRTVALVPIFRYQRDEEGASFASLPFIWWLKRADGHTRAFVGIGYWNTETGTRVFPFYGRFQQRNEDGEVKRTTEVAFPVYFRDKTARKEIVVVPPFYRIKRADGTRVHGIAPFWNEELAPGAHSWSILGDLVGYQRIGRHRRLTILFGFHKKLRPLPPKKGPEARAEPPRLTQIDPAWRRAGAEMPGRDAR